MLNIKQISIALTHARLKNVSEETGVSVYHLKLLRNQDGNIPYDKLKKVSDYFEGVDNE